MDYISVKDTAKKWEVSERWIQVLCEQCLINGVSKFCNVWLIPRDAKRLKDGRIVSDRYMEGQAKRNRLFGYQK